MEYPYEQGPEHSMLARDSVNSAISLAWMHNLANLNSLII